MTFNAITDRFKRQMKVTNWYVLKRIKRWGGNYSAQEFQPVTGGSITPQLTSSAIN